MHITSSVNLTVCTRSGLPSNKEVQQNIPPIRGDIFYVNDQEKQASVSIEKLTFSDYRNAASQ